MSFYHEYTDEELRNHGRRCIEAFEIWARRLIDQRLTLTYGANYFDAKNSNGDNIIKKSIREHAHKMMAKNPGRFNKPIDTLFIDDIISIICNINLRDSLREPLEFIYPWLGYEHLKEMLNRLIKIRNALSHSNPVSIRQIEQAVCYSNDFVEGLKEYYKSKGEEQMWNVPKILRIKDSLGNVFEKTDMSDQWQYQFKTNKTFNVGDSYSVDLELDPSFSSDKYDIVWKLNTKNLDQFKNQAHCEMKFDICDIGQQNFLHISIISHEQWHRYHGYDCKAVLLLCVLPQ